MAKRPNRPKKLRTEFRKHHDTRTRQQDLTKRWQDLSDTDEDLSTSERLTGKGDLTRKRTVIGSEADEDETGLGVQLEVDLSQCRKGRVLMVFGLASEVETDDGAVYRCAVRRLLKSLTTDQRNVVVAGDEVMFRPMPGGEGLIERIEPRSGVISRASRGRQHVIVANVDRFFIVVSAAQPEIKPGLIDRMLVTAEKSQIPPVVCINKADLVDLSDYQPLAGVYGAMGYPVLFVSAETGFGIDRLRRWMAGCRSVVAGQSGVGKSSLLNAIEPGLNLRVGEISQENEKGRHTTTAARLIPLKIGGHVVDTPGIRQFELWDVIPEEVAGFFRDLRPYVSQCRYPDCSHTHEDGCAVKRAVEIGHIDPRRYDSYCGIWESSEEAVEDYD